MSRPTLTAVLGMLTRDGYAPATTVRPAWPGGGRIGMLRRITFGTNTTAAHGALYVTASGRITGGWVDYGARGAGPASIGSTAEAWRALSQLPRVVTVTPHRLDSTR